MRVLVIGGTGVLGRASVPALRAAGHEVVTASRAVEGIEGVEHVAVDALDGPAVRAAVQRVAPDVVVNALTALPKAGARKAADLEATNRLRLFGTDNLLEAAAAAGARVVSESFLLVKAPEGGEATLALEHLERATLDAGGVVLRFGFFYGPWSRPVPLPGGSPSVFSFVHIDDAGAAVAVAVDRGEPGTVYEVADDEPVALGTFLTELAKATRRPKPRWIPLWPVKLLMPFAATFVGGLDVRMDNARLRQRGWAPRYPTYAEGLAAVASEGSGS